MKIIEQKNDLFKSRPSIHPSIHMYMLTAFLPILLLAPELHGYSRVNVTNGRMKIMQKIKWLTVETLLDLYMNYLREKINVKEFTEYDTNPFSGRKSAYMPNTEQLKYHKGKFEGFLLAYNWLFDDKTEKGFLIIRRASDNRIILRLKVEE